MKSVISKNKQLWQECACLTADVKHNMARGKILLQFVFFLKKAMHEAVLRHIKVTEVSKKT